MSNIQVDGNLGGVTPFIRFLQLSGAGLEDVASASFQIEPKPGRVSKPVSATFAKSWLERRGYLVEGAGMLTIPVFGLYADFDNPVELTLAFDDGSSRTLQTVVTTVPYADPNAVFDRPVIRKARDAASRDLGLDFFALKSTLGSPVIVDSDAEVRWTGPSSLGGSVSTFDGEDFVLVAAGRQLTRLGLDGSVAQTTVLAPNVTGFHHNIDPGKVGLLGEVEADVGGVAQVESTLIEVLPSGAVARTWDLAALLANYMQSAGDDPSAFVRPGFDWFHMNAAAYDPSDDSIIMSGREDFVVKVDYATGAIKWILGDPSKYWYTFPSLRSKALTISPGGLVPIGQHAISITSDGLLMFFNNGTPSTRQPAGAPVGDGRAYSAVSAYAIDPIARTATEVWNFDYNQSIYSSVCSSVYEADNRSMLVNFATADAGASARLVGLDGNREVAFDFEYPSPSTCATAWNAIPIPLDRMQFD